MLREYHPAVIICYFVVVAALTMVVKQPILLGANLVCAGALFILLKDNCAYKTCLMFGLTFIAITLVNPLFNVEGSSVLFTYFGGRPYTLESLQHGAILAAAFVALLFWFASLSILLPAHKVTYLFGKSFPKTTMVLTLIMRLIPMFTCFARESSWALAGIGLSISNASLCQRIKISCSVLRSVCITSIVQSAVTADSMCARGYGSGKLSHFARYRFTSFNLIICVLVFVLGILSVLNFVPNLISFISYVAIVALPVAALLLLRVSWRLSLLKM